MSNPFGDRPFPRGLLIGAGVLISLTIVASAIGSITGAATPEPTTDAVMSRDLRFEDRPDGSVAVFDAHDGHAMDVVSPGSNGFLRATLRGLARDRKRQGGGADAPFRLAERPDGRLTLEDPSTGRHVELAAFGPTNQGAFARFLDAESTGSPAAVAR